MQWIKDRSVSWAVPENSFLMACSNSCPVSFWYSSKIRLSCDLFLWQRMALNVDSSVPWNSSPALKRVWASLYAASLSVFSLSSLLPCTRNQVICAYKYNQLYNLRLRGTRKVALLYRKCLLLGLFPKMFGILKIIIMISWLN